MIHFVYLSIILGSWFVLWLYYKDYEEQNITIAALTASLEAADNNAEALDKGFVELTDAYETDSLQYESTIERLNEEKAQLQNSTKHYAGALADEMENKRHLIEENRGIRRQLDIAQVIISEHDLNCLPHIVLSSMENEKDEPLPI